LKPFGIMYTVWMQNLVVAIVIVHSTDRQTDNYTELLQFSDLEVD